MTVGIALALPHGRVKLHEASERGLGIDFLDLELGRSLTQIGAPVLAETAELLRLGQREVHEVAVGIGVEPAGPVAGRSEAIVPLRFVFGVRRRKQPNEKPTSHRELVPDRREHAGERVHGRGHACRPPQGPELDEGDPAGNERCDRQRGERCAGNLARASVAGDETAQPAAPDARRQVGDALLDAEVGESGCDTVPALELVAHEGGRVERRGRAVGRGGEVHQPNALGG